MSESLGIDSPFREGAMPKSYSADLEERVIEAVEMGASRHEAAERFEVSVSSAVKWLQRWRGSRSAAPKSRGGSVSPLEKCAERVLTMIVERRRDDRGWRGQSGFRSLSQLHRPQIGPRLLQALGLFGRFSSGDGRT